MVLKNKWKTVAVVTVAAASAALFTGCGGLEQGSVAKVYDVQITEAQMQKRAQLLTSPTAPEDRKQEVNRAAVKQLVNEEVVRREAANRGIAVAEEDIQKSIDSIIELRFAGDRDEYQGALEQLDMTEEEFRAGLRTQMLEPLLQTAIISEVQPTDEEVQEAYRSFVASYQTPEWRRLYVIVVAEEGLALQLKLRLEAGENVEQLVSQYSIDEASKSKQGVVSLNRTREDLLPADVKDAAFKTAGGQVVGPIKSDKGFYIVKVDLIEPDKDTPFELVKDQFAAEARATRAKQVWDSFLEEAAQKAGVEYRDDVRPVSTTSS